MSGGGYLQAAGMLINAAGAYYGALAQKNALKSQSSLLRFQSRMAELSARSAQEASFSIAGAAEIEQSAFLGSRGQEIAQLEASQGASGLLAGQGSGSEAIVSEQVAMELDRQVLRQNAARAVGDARMGAVQAENQATLLRSQARQAQRSARAVQPWMSTVNSLLGSATSMTANRAGNSDGQTVDSFWYSYLGEEGRMRSGASQADRMNAF
jgi:hypothetical protein